MKSSTKKKLAITLGAVSVAIIVVLASVIIALASQIANITTNVSVTYTSKEVAGNFTASYIVGGVETAMTTASGGQKITLNGGEDDNNNGTLSPTGSIALSKEARNIIFKYSFTNTGSMKYWASVSYTDTDETDKNYIITYSTDGTTYSSANTGLEVDGVVSGQEETDPKYYYIKVEIDKVSRDTVFTGNFNWMFTTNSDLIKAYKAMATTKINNNNTLKDETYICLTKEDKTNLWVKYANYTITEVFAGPTITLENACPLTQSNTGFLEEGVTVYCPIVKDIVDKLNANFTGENIENYESIGIAGKSLSNVEMIIINWGRISINDESQTIKYSYAYDRFTNKAYILNSDSTEVLYSTTTLDTVPTNYRYLTGANINNSTDLLNFSKITNKWYYSNNEGSTKYYSRPTAENFYMAHNKTEFEHSPLVIMNLNADINMTEIETLEDWEPISNWYNFGSSYSLSSDNTTYTINGDYTDSYEISLLLNGNNHKFNNLSRDVLFGALKSDSVLENFEIVYNMGSSSSYYNITVANNDNNKIASKLNSTCGGTYWNFAIMIRGISNRQCASFDYRVTALIKNVTLSGKCYVSMYGRAHTDKEYLAIIANICCESYDGGEGTGKAKTEDRTRVSFQGCSIFSGADDFFGKEDGTTGEKTYSRVLYYDHEADDGDCYLYVDGVDVGAGATITFGE